MITCPKGTICLTHVNFLGGYYNPSGLYIVNRDSYKKIHDEITDIRNDIEETMKKLKISRKQNKQQNQQCYSGEGGHSIKSSYQPQIPSPPLMQEPPAMKRMPINIETRQ